MTQDTVSDVLRGVRLRGAVFFNISGSRECAAEAPPAKDIAPLADVRRVEHVIEYRAGAHGSCWAGIPDGPRGQLGAGDAVMFPQGDTHVVTSRRGMRGDPDLSWLNDSRVVDYPMQIAYAGREASHPVPPRGAAPKRCWRA